jgi:plastocyanin
MRASFAGVAGLVAGLVAPAAPAAPAVPAAAESSGRIVGTVQVTESDGKPASGTDVIVYVVGFTEPAGDQVTTIVQQGRKFIPDLVAITVNERVSFPNEDPFLHNVFSQSGARKFDLGSFQRGESKERAFPEAGVVDVYCNIHPEMAATILVLPNRRHTRADAGGHFVLDGVPAGSWTVFAYTRRATRPTSARVTVQAGGETTVELAIVRGAEPAHLNKYGEKYHEAGQVYR